MNAREKGKALHRFSFNRFYEFCLPPTELGRESSLELPSCLPLLFTHISLKHLGIFLKNINLSCENNVSSLIPTMQAACFS